MKKTKKFIAIILTLSLVLALAAACNGGEADDAAPSVSGDGPLFTMGYSVNALDEFQSGLLDMFRRVAAERNIELIVTNADGNPDTQLSDVDALIMQEPDIIYIFPVDPTASLPAFEAATAAGIPTIEIIGVGHDGALTLSAQQYHMGILKNVYVERYLNENPDAHLYVGYIWGMLGFAALNDRYQAFIDGIVDVYPDRVEILAEQTANWSAVDAMAIMEDWLSAFPQMNTLVVQSDEMAIGAINALRAANENFDDWLIVSFDGSPHAQQHIREGFMDATVFQAMIQYVYVILDHAERIVIGGETNLLGQTIDISEHVGFAMYYENMDELLARFE